MSTLLSGEMKDTVQVNPAGAYGQFWRLASRVPSTALLTFKHTVLERFFSRKERVKLFRSWAGGSSMWIKVVIRSRLFFAEVHLRMPAIGRRRRVGKRNVRTG